VAARDVDAALLIRDHAVHLSQPARVGVDLFFPLSSVAPLKVSIMNKNNHLEPDGSSRELTLVQFAARLGVGSSC
jgi:hypothetical protein